MALRGRLRDFPPRAAASRPPFCWRRMGGGIFRAAFSVEACFVPLIFDAGMNDPEIQNALCAGMDRLSGRKRGILALIQFIRLSPIYKQHAEIEFGGKLDVLSNVIRMMTAAACSPVEREGFSDEIFPEIALLALDGDYCFQQMIANATLSLLFRASQFLGGENVATVDLWEACLVPFRASVGFEKFGCTDPGSGNEPFERSFDEAVMEDERTGLFVRRLTGDIQAVSDFPGGGMAGFLQALISRARADSWTYERLGPRTADGKLIP